MDNHAQLKQMLRQIEKSGLSSKNKIASELAQEIREYLKSTGVKKKAYMFQEDASGDLASAFKSVWAYWAVAALTELKAQGAKELQDITLPQPQNGEVVMKFGEKALKSSGGGLGMGLGMGPGGRMRLPTNLKSRSPQTSNNNTNTLSGILNLIFDKSKGSLNKRIKGVWSQYTTWYGTINAETNATRSGDWAGAANGHNISTSGRDGVRDSVWESIQKNTTNTGKIVQDVFNAINKGVWEVVYNKLSWTLKDTSSGGEQELVDREDGLEAIDLLQDNLDPETALLIQEETNSLRLKVSPTKTPEETADTIVSILEEASEEKAEEIIDETADTKTEEQLIEATKGLKAIGLTISALDSVASLLEEEDFHWLLDSHLYLQDWGKFVQGFDAPAIAKIDALIKESGDKTLGVALRSLMNLDTTKIKAFKHFIENCMDNTLVKGVVTGKPAVAYFIWLGIKALGSFNVSVHGRTVIIPAQNEPFPTQTFWTTFAKSCRGMDDTDKEKFSKDIKTLLKTYAPDNALKEKMIDKTLTFFFETINYEKIVDPKRLIQLYKGKTEMWTGVRGRFFSIVASEIVRYRYYMELEMESLKGNPLVPDTLGSTECDNAVKTLLPALPSQILEALKNEVVEEDVYTPWAEEVAEALRNRIKIKKNKKGEIQDVAKQLLKTLQLEEAVWVEDETQTTPSKSKTPSKGKTPPSSKPISLDELLYSPRK